MSLRTEFGGQLDNLIRRSLSASLRRAEPSPDVWLRLRRRIDAQSAQRSSDAPALGSPPQTGRAYQQVLPAFRQAFGGFNLIASVIEVEPLSFHALRWMAERAVYNFHPVV